MFWAYQNHLLHLLTVVAEDYPAGLHQIKIKETSMIKTEYKKGGRPTKGVAEKKKYRITVKLNTTGLLYA